MRHTYNIEGLSAFITALHTLVGMLNGPWWMNCLQHFCKGLSCCPEGRVGCIRAVVAVMMQTLLLKAPATPAVNKWSKLGPCVDVLIFGLVVHNVFGRAFEMLSLSGVDLRAKVHDDADVDADYQAAADFNALQGTRFNAAMSMLRDRAAQVAMICLAIVLEPLRAVTAWFMRRAQQVSDPCARPPILDLLNLSHSCIMHARQYLSSVIAGKSTRLILVWRHCQCGSLSEFYERCGDSVRLLRRMAMAANASLTRRYKIMKRPWVVFRLIDDRIDYATRFREACSFHRLRQCCVLPGFFRKLWSAISSADDLFLRPWQDRLRRSAMLLTLQVADIEWRHGRNRKKAKHAGTDTMGQLAARSVGAEADVVKGAVEQQQVLMHQRQLPDLPPDDEELAVPVIAEHQMLRAPTPWQLVQIEVHASYKARGQALNPLSPDTRALVDAEFKSLSGERRREYEKRSELLKSIAKENRAQRQRERDGVKAQAAPFLK